MKKRIILLLLAAAVALTVAAVVLFRTLFAPTRIAVINATEIQAADWVLNNDCRHIRVTCIDRDSIPNLSRYDAIMIYSRGLFIEDEKMAEIAQLAEKGVPVFTSTTKRSAFDFTRNVSPEQVDTLEVYFKNASRHNYRNALRYMRHIATPNRLGTQHYEPPVPLPENMYYHLEEGQYFSTPAELEAYLRQQQRYHPDGRTIALIAGVHLPMEGNREHVDLLIQGLTDAGFNVFPLTADLDARVTMLQALHPDAVLYLPMGRLSNEALAQWLHQENIPLFVPYPLLQSHETWMDVYQPVTAGTLTTRVVIPEIDGGMLSLCVATENENSEGYCRYTAERDRVEMVVSHITKYMKLRDIPNSEKRVAICYFKMPGKDALVASGMEVVPSLYNLLRRLQREGYNVGDLPTTVEAFSKRLHRDGAIMGSYAKGAQAEYLATAHPVWVSAKQYETWAKEQLLPYKYKEVTDRYGPAPGELLATADSLAIPCVQYGNIFLFPQPRSAIGDDEFKLVHGYPVAPPHNYLAAYLYMQRAFQADVLIHFGTHGNLEFTPGKSVALSQADWSDRMVGDLPHFYLYTTGNVGESVIAKRRTHAALVSYLTPPYVESGMRQRYASLLEDIHRALSDDAQARGALGLRIKQEAMRLGLHRPLELDSIPGKPYTAEELEKLDDFAEEIANEKVLGAYYTLGQPYSPRDLLTSTLAVAADPWAYAMAKEDYEQGKISLDELHDFAFIAHHYLPKAKQQVSALLQNPAAEVSSLPEELGNALRYHQLLQQSPTREVDALLHALSGGAIAPAPGGDPVLNPNVLPTGRNMYSINADNTPGVKAWEDGKRLAEITLEQYVERHGDYPRKVSYTFWAGEFINSEGATVAQALWLMGVEIVRDSQGRVVDLKLVDSETLGRPRINVMVQISGQLRDLAASRLKLITEGVRLASAAEGDRYPNYVAEGSLEQEKSLIAKGHTPKRARELATMRVFGPVNSGYSTGMIEYTEHSGSWDDEREVVKGYLGNMSAMYGDDENWGNVAEGLLSAALEQTDMIVQPRQSNTWGPISLDHVYEFMGTMSLAVKTITGKEPDAMMADYRNRNQVRMQNLKESVAVEVNATILNPTFIAERMQGGEGTAEMFGKIFRNLFGWHVTRPSSMDPELFNNLYDTYILDQHQLGIDEFFRRVNPAAYQMMTSVMLESARKGYWKASAEQLRTVAEVQARVTEEAGAACTDFVCNNPKLQDFISRQLDGALKENYDKALQQVHDAEAAKGVVLRSQGENDENELQKFTTTGAVVLAVVAILILWVVRRRRRR